MEFPRVDTQDLGVRNELYDAIKRNEREHNSDFLNGINSLLLAHKQSIEDSQVWIDKHITKVGDADLLQSDFMTAIKERV